MSSPGISVPPHRTRYGSVHPELVENELWQTAISRNWSGYSLAQHLAHKRRAADFRHNFSHSSYRDSSPGPFWSWQRFGRSSTALADGRVIHIAGEHEDSYDSDFCIYNDVVVEYPDGRREFYLYPKDVFPPTDFHTATLIGDKIILIGSLGYKDMRQPGATQVLKLDTRTLRFEPIITRGDNPGWINGHVAEMIGDDVILVVGGKIETADGYIDNTGVFELDLRSLTWRRRDHGDRDIFAVSAADYQRFKSPAYGEANPERSANPFWLEMARRNWLPSRARLQFADFAPPKPKFELPDAGPDGAPELGTTAFELWMSRLNQEIAASKLKRSREDVVWTANRRDSGRVTLVDGRSLVVGGKIRDYEDDYADPWVYNDIIVTDRAGAIAIFTYPLSVFPPLYAWIVLPHGPSVMIAGLVDRDLAPERQNPLVVLKLDPNSFELTPMPVPYPAGFWLNLYPGCEIRRANTVVFPNSRKTDADPMLGIALDLDTLTWSEPFAHVAPQSTEDDD